MATYNPIEKVLRTGWPGFVFFLIEKMLLGVENMSVVGETVRKKDCQCFSPRFQIPMWDVATFKQNNMVKNSKVKLNKKH